jgi:serine/threonine-protein kinase RsbW
VAAIGEGEADRKHTVETPNVIRLTIPAKPEYITLCRLALTGLARVRSFPDELVADMKLALTEACSNSVRHAYDDGGGSVEILYELQADRLVVEVCDDGSGFDVATDAQTDEALTEGGLGIAIIRSIADELDIERRASGGSRLRFVKLLES